MSTKKKQCTKEFKSDAVKLVTEQGYSLSEAARSLGIAASTLGRWKRENEAGNAEEGGSKAHVNVELRRLRSENKRLRVEREILKKAAAFFAKEIV